MVQAGMKCIKYLLFTFNLVFFLAGIALIAAGGYVQAQLKDTLGFNISDSGVNGPAIFLIVVGVIIFIIAFFGCCGAIKENYCMILTFGILLGIIFVFEISAGIAAYVLKDKIKGQSVSYPAGNATECCQAVENAFGSNYKCKNTTMEDCRDEFAEYITNHIYIVGAVAIAFAVVQIVGIVFACCLARAVRKEYEVA